MALVFRARTWEGASANAAGEGGLDGGRGVEGAQHDKRVDRGERELGRDVGCDGGEAEDMDPELLAGGQDGLEVGAAVVAQAQIEALPRHRAIDHGGVPFKLVADRGADEVGAVGVEPLPHQQVDVAEVHVAQVDRDLLAVAGLGAELVNVVCHLRTILLPSIWMANGDGPRIVKARGSVARAGRGRAPARPPSLRPGRGSGWCTSPTRRLAASWR